MKTDFKHLGAYLHYGARVRARRDWLLLLIVGAVLLIASALWNSWLFFRVESGENLGAAPTTATSTFNQSALTAIEEVLTSRAAEEAQYVEGGYHFIDPSK